MRLDAGFEDRDPAGGRRGWRWRARALAGAAKVDDRADAQGREIARALHCQVAEMGGAIEPAARHAPFVREADPADIAEIRYAGDRVHAVAVLRQAHGPPHSGRKYPAARASLSRASVIA
jgi:hypothetical protein